MILGAPPRQTFNLLAAPHRTRSVISLEVTLKPHLLATRRDLLPVLTVAWLRRASPYAQLTAV